MTDQSVKSAQPPPPPGAAQWVRDNLIRTPVDAALTVVFGGLLLFLIVNVGRFVFVTGEWEVVQRNLTGFLVGRFDRGQLWRPAAGVLIGALVGGMLGGLRRADAEGSAGDDEVESTPDLDAATEVDVDAGIGMGVDEVQKRALGFVARWWPLLVAIAALVVASQSLGAVALSVGAGVAVLAGSAIGRQVPRRATGRVRLATLTSPVVIVAVLAVNGGVGWNDWGGLLLNLALAAAGIALCFPFGVALALGRRSTLPAVRWLSVTYIEFFRGVPLIGLLLIASVSLRFFLPVGVEPPGNVVRAIIVFTLFTAAYVAEIVRGGLSAVHSGQAEAGRALGMSPARVTALIVLPQALRASIPALVGQFISLFKDTSLVSILGFVEVLGIAQIITQQPDFRGQGLQTETLLFAAFLFWVGSYTLSRESQRLERRLDGQT